MKANILHIAICLCFLFPAWSMGQTVGIGLSTPPHSASHSRQAPSSGRYLYNVYLSSPGRLSVVATSTSAGIVGVLIMESGANIPPPPPLESYMDAPTYNFISSTLAAGSHTVCVDMGAYSEGRILNTTFSLTDPNSPNLPPPPPPPPGDDSPPPPEDTVYVEPPTGDFFPPSMVFGDFPFSETYSQQVPTAGSYSYQVTLSSRVYLGVAASCASAGIGGVVIMDSGGQALATSLPYDPSLGTLSAATAVATLDPGIYTIWVDMVNDFDGRSLTLSFFGRDPDGAYPPPPPPPTSVPSPPEEPDDDPVVDTVSADISSLNYVFHRMYTKEDGSAWRDGKTYHDGLGRLEETVQASASPSGGDLVSYQEYDEVGRASHAWLPAVAMENGAAFVPYDDIRVKCISTYPGGAAAYSTPVYEDSPSGRILEQYGPGNPWHNPQRAVKTAYLVNVEGNDTLNCVLYESAIVPFATDTALILHNRGNHASGQLYVTRVEDEDGNAAFEFRDKRGRTILTRAINYGNGVKETLDTYYIYDIYGNMVAALPPEASVRLESVGTWTNANSAVLRDYAYLYLYDSMGRQIAKRLPGQGWTYYVYDKADRLIFTQDGNMRQTGEWLFSLPDRHGRVCVTGICSNVLDPFSADPLPTLVIVAKSLRNRSWQGVTLSDPSFLGMRYYDNYSFAELDTVSDLLSYDDTAEADGFGIRGADKGKGRLTCSSTARLDGEGAPAYLYSAMYYDDRGRLIQAKSTNQLGGVDAEYVAYDFIGQVTKRKRVHSATGKPTRTEVYAYTYDNMGRPLTTTHQLDGGQVVTLADNEYDDIGRLKTNKRNGNDSLRTDYTYNIRSWTESISGPLFSQKLYYNGTSHIERQNKPLYNGNICAMDWKITRAGESEERGYNFWYDNLSRLTAADYFEERIGNNKFSAAYSYDMHGNILSLQRHGNKDPNAYGLVDDVTFTYVGNQLVKADDAIGKIPLSASRDFKDTVDIAIEYTYDANGNMTMDGNNGIYSIAYNVLNLPKKVTFAEPGVYNEYVYSADGTKLTVFHKKASSEVRTDYVGNMIYKNDSILDMILMDGGYIKDGQYHFFLQDHLGSNRVVARADGTVVQTNHYYPYGTPFAESYAPDVQDRKYIGKEYDTDNGLDWYDVEARMMDGLRFTTMDPLAEKYYSISPYAYVAGNPVNRYDLNGDSIWYTVDKNVFTMHVQAKVIRTSGDNINMKRVASDIAQGINKAFSGEINLSGQSYTMLVDAQVEAVNSMAAVKSSDHLFVIADGDGSVNGVTNILGGKVMSLSDDYYANDNWFSNKFSSNDIFTAVHEFGHAGGLEHDRINRNNLMYQGGSKFNVTPEQRLSMYIGYLNRKINLGPNSHMGQPYPYVHYWDKVVGKWETIKTDYVLNMLSRMRR